MKISDHLKKEDKKKLDKLRKPKKEHVDWIDIMGMNRDRYGRGKGGAMRRK